MKNLLLLVVLAAPAAAAPAAPSLEKIPALSNASWDGARPIREGRPKKFVSRMYVRKETANEAMKLKVTELQLSGAKVLKFSLEQRFHRYYFYVIYYPIDRSMTTDPPTRR
jgi:hypothetical protein